MTDHRFDSISPSAKSLLLTKALTDIPFAKEAALVIWGKEALQNSTALLSQRSFIRKLIHFESRYKSVDNALSQTGLHNVLEFSSGFSFRGLALCKNPQVQYVDTDLAGVIGIKEKVIKELIDKYVTWPLTNLVTQPLNVLNEEAFEATANLLPPGPIAFANEGLLMYLDTVQKVQLCSIIHTILSKRGGYWVTADAYIRKEIPGGDPNDIFDQHARQFLADHKVEENKFESFQAAETFFNNCGFTIHATAVALPEQISAMRFIKEAMLQNTSATQKNTPRIRETWILKAL